MVHAWITSLFYNMNMALSLVQSISLKRTMWNSKPATFSLKLMINLINMIHQNMNMLYGKSGLRQKSKSKSLSVSSVYVNGIFMILFVFRLSLAPMSIKEYISLYKKTLIKVGKEQRKERVLRIRNILQGIWWESID